MEYKEKEEIREDKGYLVVEKTPGGIPRILYADGKACAMTGLSWEELSQTDPGKVTAGLLVTPVELNGGHELWVLDSAVHRRERKARLEQMNMALEEALRAAEAASQAKSNFLSNMSHDIRTPMNAITGMTAIGLSHIDEKLRVKDCLMKIQTASTHLMSLVNDVLDMSRIDSGRMSLNEEEFSLADLVHDIAVIVRPQAGQKNQKLQIEIGDICEEELLGDPLRLRQIMVNIINNAVKYTGEGGAIRVFFGERPVEEESQAQPGQSRVWLDFVCEDNGIGMSEEFLRKIFVPFERERNTTTGKVEGTGLGMAIVKKLTERMGGRIRIESEEGKGSRFTLEIPFEAVVKEQEAGLSAGEAVLVAESDGQRAGQIVTCLKAGGLKPVHRRSGLDTVTWITEAQYEHRMPCAMLLGEELSDLPVLEVASHVRQLAGKDFPILLVSGEDWPQLEYRAVRAGINAFVPCPLFKSRLLRTLAEWTVGRQDGGSEFTDMSGDYGGFCVLLAEDNELNQEIAVELLSLTGLQVEVAGNGAEAVRIFEQSPQGHFDLIFMDIQMPVMDGYEATRRIRQMNRQDAEDICIIAMTANAFVEDIRLSREAGMNEHFSKPIDLDRLQDVLKRHLKKGAEQSQDKSRE